MADKARFDMVMRFVQQGNKPVPAECTLQRDERDPYMLGFKPMKGDELSNFFEITDFDFSVGLKDEDTTKEAVQSGGSGHGKAGAGAEASKQAQTVKAKSFGRVQGEFASWRAAKSSELPNIVFPLEFESFTFKRLMDAASTEFFNACCSSRSFESATLVKRMSVGDNRLPQGFFRMVFKDVLITSLAWDDGNLLKESCTFICRAFSMKYRMQEADGSFGAEVGSDWDYKRDAGKRV